MTEITAPAAPADSVPPAKPAMSRARAALLHLLLSVGIFSAVIIPLLMLWFPPPLFFADGGWAVIQIAVGVDIVIGPLLTLIVFKSGKKSLKFDLSVIALLQFCALAWGVHLMYREHPLFLAFADDRFGTVTGSQIDDSTRPLDVLLKLGNDNPVRVLVKMPDDAKEARAVKMTQLALAKSVFTMADRYEAMTPQNYQFIYRHALDMEAFLKARPKYRAAYDEFMQKAGAGAKDLAFFPLMCRYQNVLLVLHQTDNSYAGSLDVRPPDYALFDRTWSQTKSGEK
jgi:hypothetical protein